MRTGCILLLIIAIFACSGPSRSPDGVAVEAEVLSAYLNAFYAHDMYKLLVIRDTTETRYVLSTQGMERLAEKGKVEWKEDMGPIDALRWRVRNWNVREDTLLSFCDKNTLASHLPVGLSLEKEHVLVQRDEIREIFSDKNGWREFYRRYPGSSGIMHFSRVGLSSDMDEALLYVGFQRGPLSGGGALMLFRKSDGRWIVVETMNVWVS
jgi:hypothetical protein